MQYSEAEKLLIKIDKENVEMFGPIVLSRVLGSNAYMWELDHRRWNHPEFKNYLDLREKERRSKRIADIDKHVILQR